MATDLFASYTLGSIELRNRLVMAPMTRCRATADHIPTPSMARYYGDRATGGLLITEGVAPAATGCGYARIPGLWSAEQVEGWKPVTAAVHARGGKVAAQLMHTGRVSHPLNMPDGTEVLSASSTGITGEMYTDQEGPQPYPKARAMTGDEVEEAIESYVTAANNAVAAGFDMVELHGANGYLIDQFISPSSNQRDDGWGGDAEGRLRFPLEVARRVAHAIGGERVGIRLSPFGVFNDITHWDTVEQDFILLAQRLGELRLSYIHVVDHSAMGAPAVPDSIKGGIREAFGRGTIILSGGYDRDRANADLAAGKGELVAFGRPFLANPDLADRLEKGAELNEPDFATFYTPGDEGYNDYPTL